ncbi:hypothetical protein [Candidatus Nesciobacter abundans]|uniref:Uncharacterized protein n=1 Tax=Candidatus Nesciobacter abundans TaxID=2601668 RepID=A0A5C0UHQ9_9PROT|nr:hypothetical protein [Candidatus Nesciobacter abundans]QEK39093.1 hypothetical protein FZC36_01420 [Candidatus Nesciobacter abundans]
MKTIILQAIIISTFLSKFSLMLSVSFYLFSVVLLRLFSYEIWPKNIINLIYSISTGVLFAHISRNILKGFDSYSLGILVFLLFFAMSQKAD